MILEIFCDFLYKAYFNTNNSPAIILNEAQSLHS